MVPFNPAKKLMKIITAKIGNRNLLVQYSANSKMSECKKNIPEKKLTNKPPSKNSGYLFFTLDQNGSQSI